MRYIKTNDSTESFEISSEEMIKKRSGFYSPKSDDTAIYEIKKFELGEGMWL